MVEGYSKYGGVYRFYALGNRVADGQRHVSSCCGRQSHNLAVRWVRRGIIVIGRLRLMDNIHVWQLIPQPLLDGADIQFRKGGCPTQDTKMDQPSDFGDLLLFVKAGEKNSSQLTDGPPSSWRRQKAAPSIRLFSPDF